MNRWPWPLLALLGVMLAGCGGDTPSGGTPAGGGGTADGGGATAPQTGTALDGTWMLISDDRESYITIKNGRLAIGDEDTDVGGPCTVKQRDDGKYDVHVKYDDDILGGTEDTLVIQRDGDTITTFDKGGKPKGRYKWTEEEEQDE